MARVARARGSVGLWLVARRGGRGRAGTPRAHEDRASRGRSRDTIVEAAPRDETMVEGRQQPSQDSYQTNRSVCKGPQQPGARAVLTALCLDENRDVYTALCTAGGGGGSRLCRDVRREGPHKRQSEGGEASTLL